MPRRSGGSLELSDDEATHEGERFWLLTLAIGAEAENETPQQVFVGGDYAKKAPPRHKAEGWVLAQQGSKPCGRPARSRVPAGPHQPVYQPC